MARKKNDNMECIENSQDNTETVSNKKYKTEKCPILSYNKATKELDVNFHGYGIRIKNANDTDSGFISLKYSGEIGKQNFSCKL